MSTIAADWIDTDDSRETEAAPVKLPREIEFKRALDRYMRGYCEQNLTRFAGQPTLMKRIARSLGNQ